LKNNQNLHRMNCMVEELEYKLIQYQENERRETEVNNLYNQRTTTSVEFSKESLFNKLLKQMNKKFNSKRYKTPRKNKLSKD